MSRPRSAAWWFMKPGDIAVFNADARALHKRMAKARKEGGRFKINKIGDQQHRITCVQEVKTCTR